MNDLSVHETVGISGDDLDNVVSSIRTGIAFGTEIKNPLVTIEGETRLFFNDKELRHMADVVSLAKIAHGIDIGGLVVLLLSIMLGVNFRAMGEERRYAKVFFCGILFFLGFIGAIMLWAAVNFDSAFTFMHHVFFRNDLWLLNPETDMLIRIMPLQFFIEMGMVILRRLMRFVAGGVVLYALGVIVNLPRKRKGTPYNEPLPPPNP